MSKTAKLILFLVSLLINLVFSVALAVLVQLQVGSWALTVVVSLLGVRSIFEAANRYLKSASKDTIEEASQRLREALEQIQSVTEMAGLVTAVKRNLDFGQPE